MKKSERRNRQRVLRPLFVFAALAALAVVLVPTGSASPPSSNNKQYSLCLQGPSDMTSNFCQMSTSQSHLSAGSATSMTLTITNAATTPSILGSMNVDAPSGLPITSATGSANPAGTVALISNGGANGTGQLQIRNLNLAPGSHATVTFSVQAPCTGGSFTWPNPATKQSNDFNGTGNDFNSPTSFAGRTSTLGGVGCYLGFLNQPAATQVGMTITDAIGSSGGAIKVGLFNGDGNAMTTCPVAAASCKVTMTTTPTTSGFSGTQTQSLQPDNAGNLVASFGDLSIGGIAAGQLPKTFTLNAGSLFTSAAPNGEDVSDPFEIALDIADCSTGCNVHGLGLGNTGSSLLDFSTSSDYGFVILDPTTIAPTDGGCENWSSVGVPGFVSTDQRGAGATGMTVTYYVPMKAIQAKYGKNVGQQIIPICVGAKPVDPITGNVENCYDVPGSHVGLQHDPNGWVDDTLLGNPGSFTGQQSNAVCNSDGFYYGIIGSKQDPIDASANPIISSFSSGTINGTNYRALVMSVPGDWDYKGGG